MATKTKRTRGNGHNRKLPEVLQGLVDDNSPAPSLGSLLTQFFGHSELRSDVAKLLGTFNPRLVTTATRLLMRNDPDVAFGLAILRAPLINLEYSVSGEDPFIKAFVDQELRRIYRNLAVGSTLGIHFGYQLQEKVWKAGPVTVESTAADGTTETKRIPMAWTYERFKAIDPRTYVIKIDTDLDDWVGVSQTGNLIGRTGGAEVGREKLVLWSFRKEEVWGLLTGYPISDQTYEPWWFKSATNHFANRYFERKADPAFKAFADAQIITSDGVKMDGFTFMLSQILGLKSGGGIVLPNSKDQQGNRKFDVEHLQDDKRGDMFQQRIDSQSTQILRASWITDRAATGESGSLAMAEVHARNLTLMLQTIVNEWIDEVVNPQVVRPLVVFNFGEEAWERSKVRVNASGITGAMQQLFKELIVSLLQAEQLTEAGGKVRLLDRMDAVNIAKSLGIPLLSNEEMEQLSENKAARRPTFGQPPAGEEEDEDEPEDVDDGEVTDDLTGRGIMEEEEEGEEDEPEEGEQ